MVCIQFSAYATEKFSWVIYILFQIADVDHPDILLFPSNVDALSSFYSSGNIVSIKSNKLLPSNLNGIRLKVQKV